MEFSDLLEEWYEQEMKKPVAKISQEKQKVYIKIIWSRAKMKLKNMLYPTLMMILIGLKQCLKVIKYILLLH